MVYIILEQTKLFWLFFHFEKPGQHAGNIFVSFPGTVEISKFKDKPFLLKYTLENIYGIRILHYDSICDIEGLHTQNSLVDGVHSSSKTMSTSCAESGVKAP